MISRYEVSLNGIALSSLHPDILILDIGYTPPEGQMEIYTVAKRNGSRVYRRYYDKNNVSVSLMIRSYDTRTRQSVCQQIGKWAKNGGILKTSDRPGQQLRCVCKSWPTIASALRYTDTVEIVFTANNNPFWEEDTVRTLTLSGTSGNGRLYAPGDIDCAFVEAIVHANGAISSVSLTVNDHTLTLADCAVAAGQELILSYDENMIQHISISGASMLDRRTGADDLIAKCGEYNPVSFTTDGSARVTFRTRGLWL